MVMVTVEEMATARFPKIKSINRQRGGFERQSRLLRRCVTVNRWSGSRAFSTSRQLEDGATGRSESRVSLWGVVPSRRLHRDQSWDFKSGGGALLQQARHG